MFRRMLVVLLLAAMGTAAIAAEKVELRFHYKKGDVCYQMMTQELTQTFGGETAGKKAVSSFKLETLLTDKGDARMRMTTTSVLRDGEEQLPDLKPAEVYYVDAGGLIMTERDGWEPLSGQAVSMKGDGIYLALILPNKAVAKGDKWTRTWSADLFQTGQRFVLNQEYTFLGSRKVNGREVYEIRNAIDENHTVNINGADIEFAHKGQTTYLIDKATMRPIEGSGTDLISGPDGWMMKTDISLKWSSKPFGKGK